LDLDNSIFSQDHHQVKKKIDTAATGGKALGAGGA